MKITEIIVGAGRTFPHPYEDYSNLRPQLTIKAEINGDESDIEKHVKELQAQAEKLIEDHKNHMLQSLSYLYHLAEYEQRVESLEDNIKRYQQELEDLRNGISNQLPEKPVQPTQDIPF